MINTEKLNKRREVENETKVFVLTRIQLDLLYKLEL